MLKAEQDLGLLFALALATSKAFKMVTRYRLKRMLFTVRFAGTNDSLTKRPMFQVLSFFHNFLQKWFQFIFLFFYKFTKIRIKTFGCPKT